MAAFGSRGRATLSGPMAARAAGMANSPDLGIDRDVRGDRPAYPGHGTGGMLTGSNSFGGVRMPFRQQAAPFPDGIGGPGGAYGGGWADGVLTVRDRHIMTRRGYSRGSRQPSTDPALPNRLADGPDRPQYQMVNTSEAWQIGTDKTTQEDNPGPHASVSAGWKRFPLGTQDGTQTLVMGPPPGSWREYGVRGGAGMHGPAPDVWDPNWVASPKANGAAGGGGRGLLVVQGAEGMQPQDRRTVYGGVPHGLHSPTLDSQVFTFTRFATTPQMQPPRVDRPASSKIAGQSYSQTVQPEAQAGRGGERQMPRQAAPGRTPGLLSRFMART